MARELAVIQQPEPTAPVDNEARALESYAGWVIQVEPAVVTPVGPPAPKPILLGSLEDARLQVVEPIQVSFATEHGQFIAEAAEINEFGFGRNPSEALRDLEKAIVELYVTLEMERERLGQDLGRTWALLSGKIRRIP